MDPNKPVTPPTPPPQEVPNTPQPISDAAKVATVNTSPSTHSSLIIGTIVLILTISGGLAFFVLTMKSTNQAAAVTPSPTTAVSPTLTTAPTVLSADEKELEEIVLTEDDVAFQEINFDIKSL